MCPKPPGAAHLGVQHDGAHDLGLPHRLAQVGQRLLRSLQGVGWGGGGSRGHGPGRGMSSSQGGTREAPVALQAGQHLLRSWRGAGGTGTRGSHSGRCCCCCGGGGGNRAVPWRRRHGHGQLAGSMPGTAGTHPVVLVAAVGEVEARNIHAAAQHLTQRGHAAEGAGREVRGRTGAGQHGRAGGRRRLLAAARAHTGGGCGSRLPAGEGWEATPRATRSSGRCGRCGSGGVLASQQQRQTRWAQAA